MARYTSSELSTMLTPYQNLVEDSFYCTHFGFGLLEHRNELQQLSVEDKTRIACDLIFTCHTDNERVEKIMALIDSIEPTATSSQSLHDDFFLILKAVIVLSQKYNALLDTNNKQLPNFFLSLPQNQDISVEPFKKEKRTLFAEMFQEEASYSRYIYNFFNHHAKELATNLARHTPIPMQILIYSKINDAFPHSFIQMVNWGFKIIRLLQQFESTNPENALTYHLAPRLTDSKLIDCEVSNTDLYAEFPILVREQLAGKELEIARRLERRMTPTLYGRLADLAKDCRDGKTESPPDIIMNHLQRFNTFSSHVERFGLFRAVSIRWCEDANEKICVIS